jgi:hypothetical protein
MQAPDQAAGQKARCPKCREWFIVTGSAVAMPLNGQQLEEVVPGADTQDNKSASQADADGQGDLDAADVEDAVYRAITAALKKDKGKLENAVYRAVKAALEDTELRVKVSILEILEMTLAVCLGVLISGFVAGCILSVMGVLTAGSFR